MSADFCICRVCPRICGCGTSYGILIVEGRAPSIAEPANSLADKMLGQHIQRASRPRLVIQFTFTDGFRRRLAFQHFKADSATPGAISGNRITSILEDNERRRSVSNFGITSITVINNGVADTDPPTIHKITVSPSVIDIALQRTV